MAETTISVASITGAGVAPAVAAVNADGSKFLDDGTERTFLRFTNTSGSPINVTVPAQRAVNAPGAGVITPANLVVAIPATTGDRLIGPFPAAYIDDSGFVHFTVASATNLNVAALKLARATTV